MTQTDRELFARLTLASNLALGQRVDRLRQRRTRVDFTTPGFVYPESRV